MKKLTAILLIIAMLVPLSPAVAADGMSAKPTVEEILNEYHKKSFKNLDDNANGTSSTWSRRENNDVTLELETVDELTNYGYEAYNVTADNYDELERILKTDLDSVCLNREASYIVVISGEDQANSSDSARIGGSGFNPSLGDDVSGSYFEYTHNGTTYRMRYLTITSSSDATNLVSTSLYTLQPNDWAGDLIMSLFDAFLVTVIDGTVSGYTGVPVPFASIGQLIFGAVDDDNYIELEPDTLSVHSSTVWTLHCIQVYDASEKEWKISQVSAYADSKARCAGYIYDPDTHTSEWEDGVESTNVRYSLLYNNLNQRQINAAVAFSLGTVANDKTGDIDFYLGNSSGEILYQSEDGPLFTHIEEWRIVD